MGFNLGFKGLTMSHVHVATVDSVISMVRV